MVYELFIQPSYFVWWFSENLVLVDENHEIRVPEVGRYFDKWCGKYYEPTEMKTMEYPDDGKVRYDIISGIKRV